MRDTYTSRLTLSSLEGSSSRTPFAAPPPEAALFPAVLLLRGAIFPCKQMRVCPSSIGFPCYVSDLLCFLFRISYNLCLHFPTVRVMARVRVTLSVGVWRESECGRKRVRVSHVSGGGGE